MARVLERVTATVRRHDMLPRGGSVLVAVSGGADSLCLLHALHALRRLLRIRLSVVHVDHGLRRGSTDDARYVTRVAGRLNVPVEVVRLVGRPPKGASPEAWLRTERYRAFAAVRMDSGADAIATGHTTDDQAETVLMALIRGGSLDALGGIPPVRDRIVRPLLDVTREETKAFCRAIRLRPREDPTNRDRAFLRNALRLDVLAAVRRATGREVGPTVARSADLLRRDAELLHELAVRAGRSVIRGSPAAEELRLLAGPLAALPYPLGARVVADALRRLDIPDELARAHVDAVLDLADGRPGRRVDLPSSLKAVRESGYVRLARPSPRTSPAP